MAYKTFKRIETAVDERIYQKAQALYLDHTGAQEISFVPSGSLNTDPDDVDAGAVTLTIPHKEIVPFGAYKIKALPGAGTLYILY